MDLQYIIITASIDRRTLNKLLLSLRGWDLPEESWDNCTILRSPEDISSSSHNVDKPLILRNIETEFRGRSIQEVEDLMLPQDPRYQNRIDQFCILDQQGIEEETIIFLDRALDDSDDADEEGSDIFKDYYNKVRVPWPEVYIMWCNLAIQYIGFESFTQETKAPDDGWCTYRGNEAAKEDGDSNTGKVNAGLRDLASRTLEQGVIVTAEVDVKVLNKLLLSLRDWEFGDESIWDDTTIIPSMHHLLTGLHRVDHPPLQTLPEDNYFDFRGRSVQEIESMVFGKDDEDAYLHQFLLLDQQGVKEETIIVAKRAFTYNESTDKLTYLERYDKVRVPWMETHVMWVNLKIANMDFEDFCEDFEERSRDGGKEWFTYRSVNSKEHYEPFVRRRDAVLRELAKLDLA